MRLLTQKYFSASAVFLSFLLAIFSMSLLAEPQYLGTIGSESRKFHVSVKTLTSITVDSESQENEESGASYAAAQSTTVETEAFLVTAEGSNEAQDPLFLLSTTAAPVTQDGVIYQQLELGQDPPLLAIDILHEITHQQGSIQPVNLSRFHGKMIWLVTAPSFMAGNTLIHPVFQLNNHQVYGQGQIILECSSIDAVGQASPIHITINQEGYIIHMEGNIISADTENLFFIINLISDPPCASVNSADDGLDMNQAFCSLSDTATLQALHDEIAATFPDLAFCNFP